ncbi:hypothetical protein ACFQ36_06850 [Arthrobacter sp. GCM10027362]|uniref:hypothetical protein n=1 Tax=Arthrobacter sp. GCM10027362 TaxID=3273379 RepID=UPI00362C55E2
MTAPTPSPSDQPAGSDSPPEPDSSGTGQPQETGGGTGRTDPSRPATSEPDPSPPPTSEPDLGGTDGAPATRPEAEDEPPSDGGAPGESVDGNQAARLRLVQEFNVPKADFGRYWTLSARQGKQTVLGGSGPKVPASGFSSVPAGVPTVLSGRMDPGWSRAGEIAGRPAWSCRDEGSGEGIALQNDNTLASLAAGQRVLCRMAVEMRDGPLSITKSRVVLKQGPAGRWNLSYAIRITNTSRTTDASYGLTEALEFGAGIGIVSAAWTRSGTQAAGKWPDPGRHRSATLAARGTAIGHNPEADTVHTYHVTAVVTIPAATAAGALECGPGGEATGGLGSTALLNNRVQAAVCRTVPARVLVDKVWSINGAEYRHGNRPAGFDATLRLAAPGTVQAAGGTGLGRAQPLWGRETGSYRPGTMLTVAETVDLPEGCAVVRTGGAGIRRLSTAVTRLTVRTVVECVQRLTLVNRVAPSGLANGLAGKWILTATAEGAREPELSGTSGTAGGVQAGRTYRLGDAPAFLGDQEFAAEPWQCRLDSGSGKLVQRGASIVPGYGQHITCTVANTWHGPGLEVSKNASKPVPVSGTAGTQWEVVYGISVKNPSMVSAGHYTLVDWLAFGEGVEIISARWMLPASGLADRWTDPGSFPLATLASGRAIDVMDSHDYLVTVRVRVKPGTPVRELDCLPEESEQTGLLNMVALNGDTVVQACAALDRAVGGGQNAAGGGGILLPPADGSGSGQAAGEAPGGLTAAAPELVPLSPVLAVSSMDPRGVATAAGMLLLSAILVLFLSRPRRR